VRWPTSRSRRPVALELQLLAGSVLVELTAWGNAAPAALRERLDPTIIALTAATQRDGTPSVPATGPAGAIPAPPADASPAVRGELLFLLGAAHELAGARLEAVTTWSDLVERWGQHDRASEAAARAVAAAQMMFADADRGDSRAARDALIRAGRLLRDRTPDSPAARHVQYFIALALERNQQLEEAAHEYAAVAADVPYALQAALGQARCLRAALQQAAALGTLNEAEIRKLADRAMQSARAADSQARQLDLGTASDTQRRARRRDHAAARGAAEPGRHR